MENGFDLTKAKGIPGHQLFGMFLVNGAVKAINPLYEVMSLQDVVEDLAVDDLAMRDVNSVVNWATAIGNKTSCFCKTRYELDVRCNMLLFSTLGVRICQWVEMISTPCILRVHRGTPRLYIRKPLKKALR